MKNVLIFNRITLLWDFLLEVVSELSTEPIQVKDANEISSFGYGRNLDLAVINVDDPFYVDIKIIAMIRKLSPLALIVVYGQSEHERFVKEGAQMFFDNFVTVDEMKRQLTARFDNPV